MISVGVHMYIHVFVDKKKFESYFSDDSPFKIFVVRFLVKFINRLALQLLSPEMLPSLSKSRISLFNVHLALFVQRIKYGHTILSVSIVI